MIAAHLIAIFRMPLTYLPRDRSFTNIFSIFAELTLHVDMPRYLPVMKTMSNDRSTHAHFFNTTSTN